MTKLVVLTCCNPEAFFECEAFFYMFFCLDTKEPKNQGKHERSAHFALPTPHIAFSNQIRPFNNELGSFV